MAAPDRQEKHPTYRSEQNIQNWGFDEKYQVPAVIPVGEFNDALYRLQTDATGKLKLSNLTAGQDFDYVDVEQTNDTTETYTYKIGGSGGTTVQTIVVVYTDNTKADIANVAWS